MNPNEWRPMLGALIACVVYVDGPGAAAFSSDERTQVLLETYTAVGLLQRLHRDWGAAQSPAVARGCGFTVFERTVTLSLPPNQVPARTGGDHAIDGEFLTIDMKWLDPALTALGQSGPSGTATNVAARIHALNDAIRQAANLAFFGPARAADVFLIFVTKYNCHWPAYNRGGFVVVNWNDMQTSSFADKIDRVIAHETGHVFDAPDEYGHCSVNDVAGPFDAANANCVADAPNPAARVPCLMDHSDPQLCPQTPLHWGWRDLDRDGTADLIAVPTVLPIADRAGSPGEMIHFEGVNLWDTRELLFGDQPSPKVGVLQADRIEAEIPANADGIVIINASTRGGTTNNTLEDGWFLVSPISVPFTTTGPSVFGVTPISGQAGDTVTLLGDRLAGITGITFDGVDADINTLVELGPQAASIEAPQGPFGLVQVVVTTDEGASQEWALSVFTYL